jgi:hypothetical protein
MAKNNTHSEPTPHGKFPRGLKTTISSRNLQGAFGRMFRELPAATYGNTDEENRTNLRKLGELMTARPDEPKDGFDPEESGIPALYTYFGQFVDHDITFDPMSTLMRHSDPDALIDFRTPALDLDNMYGRGPDDQPYLYRTSREMLLGEPLGNGVHDLERNSKDRAIIGDPRNDENSIVSQFQALMLHLHNRVAETCTRMDLAEVQQTVRWHYQWVIVHDFLPKIVSGDVLRALQNDEGNYDKSKLKFYHWRNDPFMPVEFSVCAYRLGHSMIRPGYRLNDATLLPIFAGKNESTHKSLVGFKAMPKTHLIDWGRFIDLPGDRRPYGGDPDKVKRPTQAMRHRLQFAYRIDTSLVSPLSDLPRSVVKDRPPSLPQRNLLRSFELGLPSGQDVARAMGEIPLEDNEIVLGKAVDHPKRGDVRGSIKTLPKKLHDAFEDNCPLWTYILAEAARTRRSLAIPVKEEGMTITTPQLGPVGGRIVAEVLLGLLFGDGTSFLRAEPKWKPWLVKDVDFTLGRLVNYALHGS